MQEYRLSRRFISRIWFRQLLLVSLLIVPVPLFLLWRRSLAEILPILALLGLAGGFILFVAVNKTRRLLSSYRLYLDHQSIGYFQEGVGERFLRFDVVTRITETAGQGLVLHGRDSAASFGVPAKLENYAEVRARLALLGDIEVVGGARGAWRRFYLPGVALATVATSVGAFASTEPWVVAVCSLILLFLIGRWLFTWNPQSEYEARLRKLAWVSVIPLLALVLRFGLAVAALVSGENYFQRP